MANHNEILQARLGKHEVTVTNDVVFPLDIELHFTLQYHVEKSAMF